MSKHWNCCAGLAVVAVLWPASVSFAATTPAEMSLNVCQRTAKIEGLKFVRKKIAAIATCLQKVSTQLIQNNAINTSAAGRTCITQFRKINDTRLLGRSLKERLKNQLRNKCDPTFNPVLAHTIDDVTGKNAPTVPQRIDTKQIDLWCANFGGDGSIDTVSEWADCLINAQECEVEQAIAEQYPRASEWLSAVKPFMMLITPPVSDPNKTNDAVNGLTTVDSTIDSDNDNLPNVSCPQPPPAPTCATACCYVEQSVGTFKPTSCFEYTGSTTQVMTFKGNCTGKMASPAGFWNLNAVDGVCTAGPLFGTVCVVGGAGNNAVAIPKDAACP